MFEEQSPLDAIMELCLAGAFLGMLTVKLTKKASNAGCFATFAEACLTHLQLIQVR